MTRDGLRREGFTGFTRFIDLDLADVPDEPGVYVLLRERVDRPTFLEKSTGGRYRRKDPTLDLAVLERAWTDGAHILYIGLAEGPGTKSLRGRLNDFRLFGQGQPRGHWSGRCVWQLADADDYTIAWRTVVTGADPREVQRDLIARFTIEHGRRPFGNVLA